MIKNRVAWLVMFFAALGLYLFENNTGTRVLLLALVLPPAASALLLYLPRLRVSAEIALPASARRGEPAAGTLYLMSNVPLRVSGTLRLQNLLTGEESARSLRLTASAKKTAELPFSVAAAHTGTLSVSLAEARAHDVFGLFARNIPLAAERTLPVPPEVFPLMVDLAESADALTDGRAYSTRRPGYDPSETFRIREYVPGDPIRQIHWKLSEKTDALLVRDLGLPVLDRMLLLAETTVLPGTRITPEDTDAIFDLLFSVSSALLAMETLHTVGWRDRRTGDFASREIASPEDLAALQDALLRNPVAEGEATVAGAYGEGDGARAYAHAALFSAYVPPDVGILCHSGRVTVLLTGKAAGAEDGVEIVAFTHEALRSGELRLAL